MVEFFQLPLQSNTPQPGGGRAQSVEGYYYENQLKQIYLMVITPTFFVAVLLSLAYPPWHQLYTS